MLVLSRMSCFLTFSCVIESIAQISKITGLQRGTIPCAAQNLVMIIESKIWKSLHFLFDGINPNLVSVPIANSQVNS